MRKDALVSALEKCKKENAEKTFISRVFSSSKEDDDRIALLDEFLKSDAIRSLKTNAHIPFERFSMYLDASGRDELFKLNFFSQTFLKSSAQVALLFNHWINETKDQSFVDKKTSFNEIIRQLNSPRALPEELWQKEILPKAGVQGMMNLSQTSSFFLNRLHPKAELFWREKLIESGAKPDELKKLEALFKERNIAINYNRIYVNLRYFKKIADYDSHGIFPLPELISCSIPDFSKYSCSWDTLAIFSEEGPIAIEPFEKTPQFSQFYAILAAILGNLNIIDRVFGPEGVLHSKPDFQKNFNSGLLGVLASGNLTAVKHMEALAGKYGIKLPLAGLREGSRLPGTMLAYVLLSGNDEVFNHLFKQLITFHFTPHKHTVQDIGYLIITMGTDAQLKKYLEHFPKFFANNKKLAGKEKDWALMACEIAISESRTLTASRIMLVIEHFPNWVPSIDDIKGIAKSEHPENSTLVLYLRMIYQQRSSNGNEIEVPSNLLNELQNNPAIVDALTRPLNKPRNDEIEAGTAATSVSTSTLPTLRK